MTTPATVRRRTPKVKPAPTPGAARILAAIEAEPGRTAADYAEALGISRNLAYRHVGRLLKDGHLDQRPIGYHRNALYPSGVKPAVAHRATLGEQLAHLRHLRGLTQAEAARLGGVHVNTLSNAEHGKTSPSFEHVHRWLVAWGVPRAVAADVLLSDLA